MGLSYIFLEMHHTTGLAKHGKGQINFEACFHSNYLLIFLFSDISYLYIYLLNSPIGISSNLNVVMNFSNLHGLVSCNV